MITHKISVTALEPEQGMTLTNGQVYSKLVYLGKNDSRESWREIPDTEVPDTEREETE